MNRKEAVIALGGVLGAVSSIAWIYEAYLSIPVQEYTVGIRILKPDGNPFVGALVQLGGTLGITNTGGVASFTMPKGTYFLFVSATEFQPLTSNLTVTSNATETVQLS